MRHSAVATPDLQGILLVGPESVVADKIAEAAIEGQLVLLRTPRLDGETGPDRLDPCCHAIVVVAPTRQTSNDVGDLDNTTTGAPLLRITGGRLMSASLPSARMANLSRLLARAGVHLSPGMQRALEARRISP